MEFNFSGGYGIIRQTLLDADMTAPTIHYKVVMVFSPAKEKQLQQTQPPPYPISLHVSDMILKGWFS